MESKHFGLKEVLLFVIVAAVIGALVGVFVSGIAPKSNDSLISDFYNTEVAVSVSPSDYLSDLRDGNIDGLVVDLRSSSEYNAGHLITAVNVPAVEMNEAQLLVAFKSLPTDKPFITYCYSEYCMLSRNVGKVLADNGIYSKHFTAGWYEIQRDFNSYIVSGTQAGTLVTNTASGSTCSANPQSTFKC